MGQLKVRWKASNSRHRRLLTKTAKEWCLHKMAAYRKSQHNSLLTTAEMDILVGRRHSMQDPRMNPFIFFSFGRDPLPLELVELAIVSWHYVEQAISGFDMPIVKGTYREL
ncbi:hypothetical protein AMTR_s00001p00272680 [Amborella trichopoda]|uniref:Uncharacterized protein n=1 Tax=Amborella trichopoda TaxID=13333 RepID=W1NN17_AMBTC|nr:hypothetical protein AMTR_s00001p00272680 [Amborella trichopoda]